MSRSIVSRRNSCGGSETRFRLGCLIASEVVSENHAARDQEAIRVLAQLAPERRANPSCESHLALVDQALCSRARLDRILDS